MENEVLSTGSRSDRLVTRCPHGCIHLTWGDVSIRFGPADFEIFVEMAREAVSNIEPSTDPRLPSELPVVH